jgi:hypothetical protein
MESIIEDMISSAYRHKDYEMAAMAYKLMYEFATTINCPSDWRDIGETMAGKFHGKCPPWH